MLTSTQIVYSGAGHKIEFEDGRCRLCGGRYFTPEKEVNDSSWVDEMLCRDLSSDKICGACAWVRKNRYTVWKYGRNSEKPGRLFIATPDEIRNYEHLGYLPDVLKNLKTPSVIIARKGHLESQKQIVIRSLDAVTYSPQLVHVCCFEINLFGDDYDAGMVCTISFDASWLQSDVKFLINTLRPLIKGNSKSWFRYKYPKKNRITSSPYGVLVANVALDTLTAERGK